MVYGADLARAAAARAGRVVLVEGYTDVIALHQAGVPETVGSMGTALTRHQVDALHRLAPLVLFCQDPDAAGQEAVERGLEGLAEANRRSSLRDVDFRVVRLPAGEDPGRRGPARRRRGDARAARRRRAAGALPGRARARARGHCQRPTAATARSASRGRRDRAAAAERPARRAGPARRRPPRASRRASSPRRLGEARRRAPQASRRGPGARRGDARRGTGQRRPPRARPPRADRARLPRPLPRPARGGRGPARRRGPRRRVRLARRPAAPAEYLRGRLRAPAADLPAGDEPLARLVAELVIRAGQLEATPEKLELEALQLDLSRLDRLIAGARVEGGSGVDDLAAERQHVLDAIRHRLDAESQPVPSGTRTSVRVMDAAWLSTQLESGRSIESIAREVGRAPVDGRVLGRTSTGWSRQHAAQHAARGGIDARGARRARRARAVHARDRRASSASARPRCATGSRRHGLRTRAPARQCAGAPTGRRSGHSHAARLTAATRFVAATAATALPRVPACRRRSPRAAARSRRGSSRRPAVAACCAATTAASARCSSTISTRREGVQPRPAEGSPGRSTRRARRRAKCVLLCANCHAEVEGGVAELSLGRAAASARSASG